MDKRHHLVISGTGRAGTSFLVRYLAELGLDTKLSAGDSSRDWDSAANAGLESFSTDWANFPYVVKSPWLGHFGDKLPFPDDVVIDGLVLPVRDLKSAAVSRSILEYQGANSSENPMFDHDVAPDVFGAVSGGVIYSANPIDVARLLAVAFHNLVEFALSRDIPIVLLQFPRLIHDGNYLFRQLLPVLPAAISEAAGLAAHAAVADPGSVRVDGELAANVAKGALSNQEIDRMALVREIQRLRAELQAATTAMNVDLDSMKAAPARGHTQVDAARWRRAIAYLRAGSAR